MEKKGPNDLIQSLRADECIATERQREGHLLDVPLAVSDADPGDEHEGDRRFRTRNEVTSS